MAFQSVCAACGHFVHTGNELVYDLYYVCTYSSAVYVFFSFLLGSQQVMVQKHYILQYIYVCKGAGLAVCKYIYIYM